jgi:hypothetical protein
MHESDRTLNRRRANQHLHSPMPVPHQIQHTTQPLEVTHISSQLMTNSPGMFDLKISHVEFRASSSYQSYTRTSGSKTNCQTLPDSPASPGDHYIQSLNGISI